MKSLLLQIGTILTVAAASSACTDSCFCPSSGTMECSNRGLYRPPEGYWPDIEVLYLEGNHISVIYNNSFSGFPNVTSLVLKNNELVEFNVESLSVMPNLSQLYLDNNLIERIIPAPAGRIRLDNLIRVGLHNNSLTYIDPDTWLPASRLEWLFLGNNPIVVPEGQAVVNHPTLQLLEMNNDTFNLGPRTFEQLPMLKEAELDNSGTTSIQGVFVNNTKLITVKLNNNLITEVTAGTFAPTNTFRALFLDENPLQRLDVAALDNAMSLVSGGMVSIRDTPLVCNCGHEELYWWAMSRGVMFYDSCGDVNCRFNWKL